MNREIHYRYAIAILLFAIILLVALAYFNVPDLVAKLDFALTMSSLLLAILAIIFTISGESKQQGQIALSSRNNESIAAAAIKVDAAATRISTYLDEAPRQFKAIESKLDQLGEAFTRVPPAAASEMEAGIAPDAVADAGDDEDDKPRLERGLQLSLSSSEFTRFFLDLQVGVMALLYMYWRAQRRDISFGKAEYEKAAGGRFSYAVGALSVLGAVGLVTFKIHRSEVVPVKCADVVGDELPNLIRQLVSQDFELAKILAEKVASIDEFFGGAADADDGDESDEDDGPASDDEPSLPSV